MKLPSLSLYVHIPWCTRKCPYCDFNSHESADLPEADYVDALLQDLDQETPHLQGRALHSIFIGGGTPSLFSGAAIAKLIDGIRARVELPTNIEITMEANPGSAEAQRFAAYRDAGVNRLSLGIQSFSDTQLQALGRVHNADEAHRAIAMAQQSGFEKLNLDLMHGLPGQSCAMAAEDLRLAVEHAPSHLSWYQLTVEANTVFYKRPPTLPVEDELADIQAAGEALLEAAGFAQYEVSAYCQPGQQCDHNTHYWQFGDYLGIGAGAHGKVTFNNGRILRYSKRKQPQEYLGGLNFVGDQRWVEEDEIIGEFMLNALRLRDGFSPELYGQQTGRDLSVAKPILDGLQDQGLLEISNRTIRPSPLGRRFLDSVVAQFFPD